MTDKILYCVLNWGLGHASRSVPIIKDLIKEGNETTIASDGVALQLLKKEFPSLPHVELPSYDIEYKYESIVLNILGQSIKILRAIKKEREFISQLLESAHFNTIISDNRFGCAHSQCKSIFITHQIRLLHPNRFIQASGTRFNTMLINKFDECWVPDYEDDSALSGAMSHGISLDIPLKYIGPKSRFSKIQVPIQPSIKVLAILSGPEPQRSIFQNIILEQCKGIEGKHIIISGIDEKEKVKGNTTILGLKNVDEIAKYIADAAFIVSRAGYSSLMDFTSMNRKAILVPTPGQTEQEYLAQVQRSKGRHIVFTQENIDLKKITH